MSIAASPLIESGPLIIHRKVVVFDDRLCWRSGWGVYIFYTPGQQDQLALIQGTVTTNLVDVYKLLGGGWLVREGVDPVGLLTDSTRQEMLDRTKAWRKIFKPQREGE